MNLACCFIHAVYEYKTGRETDGRSGERKGEEKDGGKKRESWGKKDGNEKK